MPNKLQTFSNYTLKQIFKFYFLEDFFTIKNIFKTNMLEEMLSLKKLKAFYFLKNIFEIFRDK